MAYQRLDLLRKIISNDFDDGENDQLLRIHFDPSQPDTTGVIPGESLQTYTSKYPISIREYKVTVLANTPVFVWQYYCDYEVDSVAKLFDPGNIVFTQSKKKYTIIPGSRQTAFDGSDAVYNSHWTKGVLRFKAGRWSAKANKGKGGYVGGPAPIRLGNYRPDTFGIAINNFDTQNDRRYKAYIEITKWNQHV